LSAPGDSSFSGAVFCLRQPRTAFNETVMLAPYTLGSEMSIVGPPPRTPGGRFFLLKRKRARHDELGEGFGWPGPRVYGLVNPKVYEVVSSLKILGEIVRLGRL